MVHLEKPVLLAKLQACKCRAQQEKSEDQKVLPTCLETPAAKRVLANETKSDLIFIMKVVSRAIPALYHYVAGLVPRTILNFVFYLLCYIEGEAFRIKQ